MIVDNSNVVVAAAALIEGCSFINDQGIEEATPEAVWKASYIRNLKKFLRAESESFNLRNGQKGSISYNVCNILKSPNSVPVLIDAGCGGGKTQGLIAYIKAVKNKERFALRSLAKYQNIMVTVPTRRGVFEAWMKTCIQLAHDLCKDSVERQFVRDYRTRVAGTVWLLLGDNSANISVEDEIVKYATELGLEQFINLFQEHYIYQKSVLGYSNLKKFASTLRKKKGKLAGVQSATKVIFTTLAGSLVVDLSMPNYNLKVIHDEADALKHTVISLNYSIKGKKYTAPSLEECPLRPTDFARKPELKMLLGLVNNGLYQETHIGSNAYLSRNLNHKNRETVVLTATAEAYTLIPSTKITIDNTKGLKVLYANSKPSIGNPDRAMELLVMSVSSLHAPSQKWYKKMAISLVEQLKVSVAALDNPNARVGLILPNSLREVVEPLVRYQEDLSERIVFISTACKQTNAYKDVVHMLIYTSLYPAPDKLSSIEELYSNKEEAILAETTEALVGLWQSVYRGSIRDNSIMGVSANLDILKSLVALAAGEWRMASLIALPKGKLLSLTSEKLKASNSLANLVQHTSS